MPQHNQNNIETEIILNIDKNEKGGKSGDFPVNFVNSFVRLLKKNPLLKIKTAAKIAAIDPNFQTGGRLSIGITKARPSKIPLIIAKI